MTTADVERLSLHGAQTGWPQSRGPRSPTGVSKSRRPTQLRESAAPSATAMSFSVVRSRRWAQVSPGQGHAAVRPGSHPSHSRRHPSPEPSKPIQHERCSTVEGALSLQHRALSSPPPAGPQSVQRRVPIGRVLMVTGRRRRLGRTHAGGVVTTVVEDRHFAVLDGIIDVSPRARTWTTPVRNSNADRPRRW